MVALQAVLLLVLAVAPWGTAWPRGWPVWVLGGAALVAGAALAVAGMLGLGSSLTPTPVPLAEGDLRTGGIYSRVRHPIYTGLLVGAAGWTVWAASWWHVAAWLALLALFAVKARWEESMLHERHPGYGDYAAEVPRFVPRRRP